MNSFILFVETCAITVIVVMGFVVVCLCIGEHKTRMENQRSASSSGDVPVMVVGGGESGDGGSCGSDGGGCGGD